MLRMFLTVAAKAVILTVGAMFLSALWLNFVDAASLQTGSGGMMQASSLNDGALVARDRQAIAPHGLGALKAD